MLIGAITMLARVIGFGRQVVFAHTVQALCLGTAYTTANMVPNIIYDVDGRCAHRRGRPGPRGSRD